jgi:hypothetical protein
MVAKATLIGNFVGRGGGEKGPVSNGAQFIWDLGISYLLPLCETGKGGKLVGSRKLLSLKEGERKPSQ